MSEDLTRRILLTTGVDPCATARERLASGEGTAFQRSLLEAHLAHCPACQHLAAVLRMAADHLPELAVLDPGPTFTTNVLARTSKAVRITPLERIWRRPRLALEAAWLGTAAGVIVMAPMPKGAPAALIAHLGHQAETRTQPLLRGPQAAHGRRSTTRTTARTTHQGVSRIIQAVHGAGKSVARWFTSAIRWMRISGNPDTPAPVTPPEGPAPKPPRSSP